jgi:hypothetical protein
MLTESDRAERSAAYQELNKMAIDDYCILTPMYAMNGIIAMAPELRGSGFCVYCTIEFLPETAWLDAESGLATTSHR